MSKIDIIRKTMPTTGERRKRGGGEGRSERGGERTLGEGEGEGEEGEEGKGRGERERERFIRNYLHACVESAYREIRRHA